MSLYVNDRKNLGYPTDSGPTLSLTNLAGHESVTLLRGLNYREFRLYLRLGLCRCTEDLQRSSASGVNRVCFSHINIQY
jgi:hypothetical protein